MIAFLALHHFIFTVFLIKNVRPRTDALQNGQIAAAGLDVLAVEPMREDNPLRQIKDSEKLLITPHIGWASVEARTRLMHTIAGQIREFFEKAELL